MTGAPGSEPTASRERWETPLHPQAQALIDDFFLLADDSAVALIPHAVRAVTELGVPETLSEGCATVDEIADRTGAAPGPLRRLLRALATVGLFHEVAPGRIALTRSGRRLLSDAPDSVRASVVNTDSQHVWSHAKNSFRTGSTAFDDVLGLRFFDYKNDNEPSDVAFLRRMRERAHRLYGSFAASVDWSTSGVVMDIGGGDGCVLAQILQFAPHVHGVLFDRKAVIDRVEASDRYGPALAGRWSTHPGDFFNQIPGGADTHLICSVLHDWNDADAAVLLRNSWHALSHRGRLIIVEMVVPEGDDWHPSKWSDLGMLVLTGGKERTLSEFEALLCMTAYSLKSVRPIPGSYFSVLEAVASPLPNE